MKPKRIILVRHGESLGNVDKTVYASTPDHALPLTEAGHVQALKAGQEIRDIVGNESVHFWVSPYLRTRQTFKGIAQSFDPKQVVRAYEHWGLREQDWGHFREKEATDILEVERDKYGANFYRFPGGESVADVWDRQGGVIDTMFRDFAKPNYTTQNVVLVTHGRTMRVFCTRWFHWSIEYSEELANPKNCEVWVMERKTHEQERHDEVHGVWISYQTDPHYTMVTKPRMHKEVPTHTDLMSYVGKKD